MNQYIGSITLLVADYDQAIQWYVQVAGFELVQDTVLSAEKRWVILSPPGAQESRLLLARAATPEQLTALGCQAGGRVFLFLHTDDFWRDYRRMQAQGAHFLETPREEPYGTVAVFEDLYGNRWDLIEHRSPSSLQGG